MGEMAVHLHLFTPPSTRPSTATTAAATPSLQLGPRGVIPHLGWVPKLMRKSVNLQSRSFQVLQLCKHVGVHNRETLIVRASVDIDGADSGAANPPEEAKAEASVEKLPFESKQQLLEANKLRMKLAKKVRLRRKRLVRKRILRKKGRWPPLKMKKNKNV